MTAFSPGWYCARTKPKHEHIAARNLTHRLGLEVFHPRLRLERATRRGMVRVIEPVFPCYVFVRCSLGEYLAEIRSSPGISSLVQFGLRIPAVPDHVIESLRQCFETSDMLYAEDELVAGTEVTVVQGPFLGAQAIVARVFPAKRRVQVLLDFLGRTTLAEVDRDWLTAESRSLAAMVPSLATTAPEAMTAQF